MGCARYGAKQAIDHRNDHDQLCLIDEGDASLRIDGFADDVPVGTLAMVHAGEHLVAGPSARRPTLIWSIYHFRDPAMRADCPALFDPDPRRRVCRLDERRLAEFHAGFERLYLELHGRQQGYEVAARGLLGLLLVTVSRWLGAAEVAVPAPIATADREVLALWRLIAEHAGSPNELQAALRTRVQNYDSLRHRFTKVVGETPRRMLARLRMERAKKLLIETSFSIAEVAERVGYARQHEFARAFHREVGCTPSWWREKAGDPRKG
jgi:AraC-like DNA-binding protein